MSRDLMPGLKATVEGQTLLITTLENSGVEKKALGANHGLIHALVKGMVEGVSAGFERKLETQGVGYRAAMDKGKLTMSLGFSHPVLMELPKGITVDIDKQTLLTVKGMDKYLVGETAAKIR